MRFLIPTELVNSNTKCVTLIYDHHHSLPITFHWQQATYNASDHSIYEMFIVLLDHRLLTRRSQLYVVHNLSLLFQFIHWLLVIILI